MIQFYFLSVFLNALAGYVLISEDLSDMEINTGFSLTNETFRLVLGILAMVTGLLKLLSAIDGDLRILGDLLPAAAGLVSGFILVFEYYRSHSTLDGDESSKIDSLLVRNKKIIGFVALISAALHFLFPKVLLL
jgi:hypothetical protein